MFIKRFLQHSFVIFTLSCNCCSVAVVDKFSWKSAVLFNCDRTSHYWCWIMWKSDIVCWMYV